MRHLILLLALLSASCTSTLPSFKTYKLDVQQGNVVTSKMMLQLKPGMTKSQVRYVMGTPLLQDSFHLDRWDYLYQMNKDGRVIERRRVILEFSDNGLKAVRGDVILSGQPGAEGVAMASVEDVTTAKSNKALLNEDPKKGWLDRFKFWGSDELVDKVPSKVAGKPVEKLESKIADSIQSSRVVEPTLIVASAPKSLEDKVVSENSSSLQVVKDASELKQPIAHHQTDAVVDDKNQVLERVASWADAWRNKNISVYLSFYSNQFKPIGLTKKAWLLERKKRLSAKQGDIKLGLENVVVSVDGNKVNVEFFQHYSSPRYSDQVVKVLTLVFERDKNKWMIVKESVTSKISLNGKPVVMESAKIVKSPDEEAEYHKKPKMEILDSPVDKPLTITPESQIQPESVQDPVKKDVEQSVAKPQSAKDKPLSADEPGYFERMLEKIGF